MMKKYEKPIINYYQLDVSDIILASNFEMVETNKIGEGVGEIW